MTTRKVLVIPDHDPESKEDKKQMLKPVQHDKKAGKTHQHAKRKVAQPLIRTPD
jgi:hypothetical protein